MILSQDECTNRSQLLSKRGEFYARASALVKGISCLTTLKDYKLANKFRPFKPKRFFATRLINKFYSNHLVTR